MKTRLHIAQICPFYYPVIGGMETHVQMLAEGLVSRGHKVTVLTTNSSRKGKIKEGYSKINGVDVIRYPVLFPIISGAKFWPTCSVKVLIENFDIIHTHNYRHPHGDLSALAGKLRDIPSILTTHDPIKETPLIAKFMEFYDRYLALFTTKLYDRIILISDGEISFFKSKGIHKRKLILIPNGVPDFYFKPGNGTSFRQKLGLNDSDFLILQVSRIDYDKGMEFIIKAMPYVLKLIPSAKYIVVGPTTNITLYNKLLKIIRHYNLDKNVIFTGPLSKEEVRNAYYACDVFVYIGLGQRSFSYGISTLEAMAVGKPVIINKNAEGGFIKNNISGLMVRYGDVKNLVEILYKLYNNESFRKILGRRARMIVSNFAWSRIVTKIESVYYEVLKERI